MSLQPHLPVVKLVLGLITSLLLLLCCDNSSGDEPRLTDDRLAISLFASHPRIVTPIGMVINDRDQIFVIESHTHHPPADYDASTGDRIKIFVDRDDDGRPDEVSVFADGLQHAMNLAVSPTGELFVVCAREVLHLIDSDGDGVCDQKKPILRLETREKYAHNCLLGITFDRDGWMYVSRGNTGSQYYRFRGAAEPTASTSVEGYGDGGSVVRCRPDGRDLQGWATGFWNPFDLKFESTGRLLLVDNDPDARGPNRILHVVRHGDYGYKSRYGGAGTHPFQGWDGSLPGTLPFLAATGEAPSGLIDCQRTHFPSDYRTSVLATIWNENSIERFDLRPFQSTLRLHQKQVFLQGGKDFRPVALDCDSRGNLFVTDWVLVNYPNHGHGRIWRIAAKDKQRREKPRTYFAAAPRDGSSENHPPDEFETALQGEDSFAAHRATVALAEPLHQAKRVSLLRDARARVRLGALLASRRAGDSPADIIPMLLGDEDEQVRIAALVWAGESLEPTLRSQLADALKPPMSGRLFDTYLAALETLDPSYIDAYVNRRVAKSNQLKRELPTAEVIRVLLDTTHSPSIRALALERLDSATLNDLSKTMRTHLRSQNDGLSKAILHAYRGLASDPEWLEILYSIALDKARSVDLRCESLLALSYQTDQDASRLRPLLRSSIEDLAIETQRTLRAWNSEQPQTADGRPRSDKAWLQIAALGGSAARGRRVFLKKGTACTKCHSIDGRGRTLGPDLSRIGQSKTRRQIAEAILEPSAEFPPQFQAWIVVTTDGQVFRGLQLDHKAGGAIELILDSGEKRRFGADEIETYAASPTSLMPDGLESQFRPDEFRDLIAFLASTGTSEVER